jgi:hypothetical protein
MAPSGSRFPVTTNAQILAQITADVPKYALNLLSFVATDQVWARDVIMVAAMVSKAALFIKVVMVFGLRQHSQEKCSKKALEALEAFKSTTRT